MSDADKKTEDKKIEDKKTEELDEQTEEASQGDLETIANENFRLDFSANIRCRQPLLYVLSNDENRFLRFAELYGKVKGYKVFVWDVHRGIINLHTGKEEGSNSEEIKDPIAILDHIITESTKYKSLKRIKVGKDEYIKGIIYILLDYNRYLEDAGPHIERRLKCISNCESVVMTIVTGSYYSCTPTVEKLFSILDFPYPNEQELKSALWEVTESIKDVLPTIIKKTEKIEEELIKSVMGLTLSEAQLAFSKSLIYHRDWDIKTILNEKRQAIRRSGVLDYCEPKFTIEDIGGLKNLVDWVRIRRNSFTDEAREYGIAVPRGLLMIGMSGCGKSLACKAISSLWGMPLLRLDFGKLFGQYVGTSEQNARDAIRVAEELAPCVSYDTDISVRDTLVNEYNYKVGQIYDSNELNNKYVIDGDTTISILRYPLEIDAYDIEENKKVVSRLRAIIRRRIGDGKKTYKVTLEDGTFVKVSEDHKFLVIDNNEKKWMKIKDIRENMRIITL